MTSVELDVVTLIRVVGVWVEVVWIEGPHVDYMIEEAGDGKSRM